MATPTSQSLPLHQRDLNDEARKILDDIADRLQRKWIPGESAIDTVNEEDRSGVRDLVNRLSEVCEVEAEKYTFNRFKIRYKYHISRPILFCPLRIEPGTFPAISGCTVDAGKLVYITGDVEITPCVEALLLIGGQKMT